MKNKGPDSWSISELVHALVIMTTYHSLCGFVGGMGINHEVDMVDLTTHRGSDPSKKAATTTPSAAAAAEEEAAKAAAYEKILDEKAQQQRSNALHEQLERLLSINDAKDDGVGDRMSFNTADDCT